MAKLRYSVDAVMMKRTYVALDAAHENAKYIYDAHIETIKGESNAEEKRITSLILDEIIDASKLLNDISSKYGKFGA